MLKKYSFKTPLFICLLNQLLACSPLQHPIEQRYQEAVVDAALVKATKISTHLVPVTVDNSQLVWNADKSKILVLTWKQQAAYDKFLRPNTHAPAELDYAVWVTTAPQVQQFCQNFLKNQPTADKAALDLRLKQYLGLDASWNYDVFVEMWVAPQDLFRPCVDPDINDSQCELQFSKTPPQIKNIGDYVGFYKNLYFKSFRASSGVPWTGLGYTYDWGNLDSTVGASEFILVPNAAYEIKQVVPTQAYCAIQ